MRGIRGRGSEERPLNIHITLKRENSFRNLDKGEKSQSHRKEILFQIIAEKSHCCMPQMVVLPVSACRGSGGKVVCFLRIFEGSCSLSGLFSYAVQGYR